MGLRLRGGIWYLRKNIGGKRHEVSTGYKKKDQRKAELAAAKIISRLIDEQMGLAPKTEAAKDTIPTFGTYADTYSNVYSAKKAKPKRDAAILKWWKTAPFDKKRTWTDTPIDQFTPTTCEAALQHRRDQGTLNPTWKDQKENVAEGTVQRERGLIQAVFEAARRDRIITHNPWEHVGKEAGEARNRILTEADEAKVLAAFEGLPPGPGEKDGRGPRWQRFVTLVLETGLRLDEVQKIEPRDRTYRPGYLHVHGKGRKRLTRCNVCKRMGGKCRDVVLTTKATKALDDQWATEKAGWTQYDSRYRDVLFAAAKRAKILNTDSFPHDSLSPHDLRHTFGARFLQRGGDIYVLSKMLGHSSVQVTQRHYAFIAPDDVGAKVLAVMEPMMKPTKRTTTKKRKKTAMTR
jgi:integrase/recombinase XerD